MNNFSSFLKRFNWWLVNLILIAGVLICELLLFIVVKQPITFKAMLIDFSFYAILFLLVNLIPHIKTRKALLIFLYSVLCVILVADSLYAAYYHNYASIHVISEIGNVAGGQQNDMGLRIVWFTLIQCAILAFGLAIIICTPKQKPTIKSVAFRNKSILCFVIISCLGLFNYSTFYQIRNKTYANNYDYYTSDTYLYNSLYSTQKYIKAFGYVNFRLREMTLNDQTNTVINLNNYFAEKEPKQLNSNTGAFKGYNVLNILSETLDTKIITHIESLLLNNANPSDDNYIKELMPNLYAILEGTAGEHVGLADSGSIIFDNYYAPQFVEGCTINSEFMSISSLHPITNRIWSSNVGNQRSDRDFSVYSLPAQLNSTYETYYAHGNVGAFYKRNQLIPNLGFENVYFQDNTNFIEVEGNWIYDTNMMYFLNKIDTTKMFSANLLTFSMHLGNHTAYPDIASRARNVYNAISGQWNNNIVNETTNSFFLEYLTKAIYFDDFIGEVLNWVSQIERPTIINIYPDHYNYGLCTTDTTGLLYEEYLGVSQNNYEVHHMKLATFVSRGFNNYKTNHFVEDELSKLTGNKISYLGLMSTIDLTTTILNWVAEDISSYNFNYFFGHDYFDNPENNYVYFQDIAILTKDIYFKLGGNYEKNKNFEDAQATEDSINLAKDIISTTLNELNICKSLITLDYFAHQKALQ